MGKRLRLEDLKQLVSDTNIRWYGSKKKLTVKRHKGNNPKTKYSICCDDTSALYGKEWSFFRTARQAQKWIKGFRKALESVSRDKQNKKRR